MLDLDNPEIRLPAYEIKLGGQTKTYDALVLGYSLRNLEGVEDPEQIRQAVITAFKLKENSVTSFEACLILTDFKEFTAKEAEEPLKKVFGRALFSDTTITSALPKSES